MESQLDVATAEFGFVAGYHGHCAGTLQKTRLYKTNHY